MTAVTKRVFTITCDSCSNETTNLDNNSALEARVSAGIAGWGYRQGAGNSRHPHLRPPLDWCPDCTEELALKAVQEAQA